MFLHCSICYLIAICFVPPCHEKWALRAEKGESLWWRSILLVNRQLADDVCHIDLGLCIVELDLKRTFVFSFPSCRVSLCITLQGNYKQAKQQKQIRKCKFNLPRYYRSLKGVRLRLMNRYCHPLHRQCPHQGIRLFRWSRVGTC